MKLAAVRYDVGSYRVFVPTDRPRNTVAYMPDWRSCCPDSGRIVSTRVDLARLGAWTRLAAVSRHSMVWVPLNPDPKHEVFEHLLGNRLLDLLFVRDVVGLRPAEWKRVRRGLRHGRPTTVQPPAARPSRAGDDDDEDDDYLPYWEPCAIRLTEHATTMVVAGSARALFLLGDTFSDCSDPTIVGRNSFGYGFDRMDVQGGTGLQITVVPWRRWRDDPRKPKVTPKPRTTASKTRRRPAKRPPVVARFR